jgi:hypothetical protein
MKLCLLIAALLLTTAFAQTPDSLKPRAQNPSPMAEYARRHERIAPREHAGLKFELDRLLPKPIEVFVPRKSQNATTLDLLLHFHGPGFITQEAATKYRGALAAATVNLGAGSSVYGRPFEDSAKFSLVLDTLRLQLESRLRRKVKWGKIILSGFSAGYGAVRKIIGAENNFARVDAILLLDGLHTSYIPERQVLAEGGRIDSTGLSAFMRFARAAARPKSAKRFLITHSEIFPGTFASTTEASDFILQAMEMKREAILKWGPSGMQQLSLARRGRFEVQGFAGNTAPDHVDHLHALGEFVKTIFF